MTYFWATKPSSLHAQAKTFPVTAGHGLSDDSSDDVDGGDDDQETSDDAADDEEKDELHETTQRDPNAIENVSPGMFKIDFCLVSLGSATMPRCKLLSYRCGVWAFRDQHKGMFVVCLFALHILSTLVDRCSYLLT